MSHFSSLKQNGANRVRGRRTGAGSAARAAAVAAVLALQGGVASAGTLPSGAVASAWLDPFDSPLPAAADPRSFGETFRAPPWDNALRDDDDPLLSAAPAPVAPLTLWGDAFARRNGTIFNTDGIANFKETRHGADFGLNRQFVIGHTHRLVFGGTVGERGSSQKYDSGGTGSVFGGTVSLHGAWFHASGWSVAATGGANWLDHEYTGTAFGDGDFANQSTFGSIEISRMASLRNGLVVEARARATYAHVFAETFSETGGRRVLCSDSDIARAAGEIRFRRDFAVGDGFVRLSARAGVAHQESIGGAIRVGDFRATPDTDGASAFAGVGVALQFSEQFQFGADFDASYGRNAYSPWALGFFVRGKF
ncbi:MAG: autotransporter outer membrane beta-barrel domain-containing protein [Puniceicoccales bacterium]|nr:autotransporter outer membrane beta-barrel domain-containing protein [Puniceicoccales bacterium]